MEKRSCKECIKGTINKPDFTHIREGFYIASDMWKTSLNPYGVIFGPIDDETEAREQHKNYVFLRRLIQPYLIKFNGKAIRMR